MQKSKFLRGDDMHAETIFELPFALQGYHALGDIGSDIGVYVQVEGFDTNLVD